MAKQINYPPAEWVEQWVDRYADKATEPIVDWNAVKEMAMAEWWDNEIEHDRPTPYDLTPEQEKEAAKMRKGARAVNPYGKEVKRERKPNEAKRELVAAIAEALTAYGSTITNPERQVDFTWQGVAYSVTLTAHRPPKK